MDAVLTPSVGMIIAAKDAADTVSRALTSAMNQPEVTEIILVNDGSTDATEAVARCVAGDDRRVRFLSNPKPLGPAAARNAAIRASSADLVGILDADDFLLPGRTRAMLERFKDCDFLADDLLCCTSHNGPIHARNIVEHRDGPPQRIDFATFIRANITNPERSRGEMGFIKPLISRQFLVKTNLAYREELRLGEDYAFYADALRLGAKFRVCGPCGYVSLLRPDSLSAKHETEDLQALYDFDRRLLAETLELSERAAVEKHLGDTRNRLALRRLLDAKSGKKYIDALRILLKSPRTAAYITRELARAKLGVPTLKRSQ